MTRKPYRIESRERKMRVRRALITGVTGQDGSYLAELLLEKGYEVHGLVRRSSSFNTDRVDHLYPGAGREGARFVLHHGDLTDAGRLIELVRDVRPDEVYNLGAQSHVAVSFENPRYSVEVDALGTLHLLEACRHYGGPVRYYQASSSEMFGKVVETPQRETTPFRPRSPYACAKVYSYYQTSNYREAYGLFACNGILFNHESPRRGMTFVTRKITRAAARIRSGLQRHLYLGNVESKRDWGYAGDYVEAMWRMLQADEPDDYVVATGRCASVREFAELAFAHVGLDLDAHLRIDERYMRPAEVDLLLGDASKAQERLGWQPRVQLPELVAMMVDADMQEARSELVLRRHGLLRRGVSA